MASQTNPFCAKCPKARNTVNGRYCLQCNINVEYAKEPPCRKN